MSRRGLDVLACALLVATAVATWRYGAPNPRVPVPADLPAWATVQDTLLDGNDAGNWAEQSIAFDRGLAVRLDPHRAPTWTLLTEVVRRTCGYGPALAGHLVDHLLRVALGPLVYVVARGAGIGRIGAAAAAVAVLMHPAVRHDASAFGVDMTTTVAWIAAVAAALAVRTSPGRAALAGVVTAFAFTTHFTTLLLPIPIALLLLAHAPARRLAVLAAWGVSFGLVASAIYRVLPPMSFGLLIASIYVGMVDGDRMHGAAPAVDRLAAVLDLARHDALPAMIGWFGAQLGAPGVVAIGLVLVGALGLGLVPRGPTLSPLAALAPRALRIRVDDVLRGLATGLPIVAPLGVLPAYFLVSAPLRYAGTLLPLVVVLVVRGVASLTALVLRATRASSPAWIPSLAGAIVVIAPSLNPPPPAPHGDGDRDAVLAAAAAYVAERWPSGTDVATATTEVSAAADAMSCPADHCPIEAKEAIFRACLATLRATCAHPGSDTIPYVVAAHLPIDDRPAPRAAMDAWIAAAYPAVTTFASPTMRVDVIALPAEP